MHSRDSLFIIDDTDRSNRTKSGIYNKNAFKIIIKLRRDKLWIRFVKLGSTNSSLQPLFAMQHANFIPSTKPFISIFQTKIPPFDSLAGEALAFRKLSSVRDNRTNGEPHNLWFIYAFLV